MPSLLLLYPSPNKTGSTQRVPNYWVTGARASPYVKDLAAKSGICPPDSNPPIDERLLVLDAEPPAGGAVSAC